MSDRPWEEREWFEEREGTEASIAIVRSAPIRLRMTRESLGNRTGCQRLTWYLRDRRIATRDLEGEEIRLFTDSTLWREPVELVGLARYGLGGRLLLMLLAEARHRHGPFDSEVLEYNLGYRYRAPERQRFPGDLERETRDFFGSLLQGPPTSAISKLFEEARKQADWRHQFRLENDGHEPGRDIAEGVWRNRIRQKGGDR